MRVGHGRHRKRGVVVELTPMIDVVFLLIIFFMTTARFSQLTRADVDLPRERGEQQEVPEEAGIVINITRTGELIVFSQGVTLKELRALIIEERDRKAETGERIKLQIRADRNGSARRLNEVVGMLTELGVSAAGLATEVPR